MKKARNEVHQSRHLAFLADVEAWRLLPEALQPLGQGLEEMKDTLVDAYRDFEKDFDGSKVLLVFPKLKNHLQRLAEQAHDLHAKPLVMQRTLNVEGTKQLDVEDQGWQDYLEEQEEVKEGEGVEEQPTDTDPFVGVLGKRKRYDSPPSVDPAVRRVVVWHLRSRCFQAVGV